MDCAANPTDPVCMEFYGAPGANPTAMDLVKRYSKMDVASASVLTFNQGGAQGGVSSAGANVIVSGGGLKPLATGASGLWSLWAKIPWWVKLAAFLGGGYYGYKKWLK
jgi:hypothetical protein